MKRIIGALFIVVVTNVCCFAVEFAKHENGWIYPMNRKPSETEWNSWKSYSGHVGHDYMQCSDLPVRAIADGEIVDYNNSLSYYGSSSGDVGGAVLLKHKTSEGLIFYAVYGHNYLKSGLKEGAHVDAGEVIAITHAYTRDGRRQDHIHFGIHPDTEPVEKNRFRGVSDTAGDYGWVNPKDFLNKHVPLNNQNVTKEIQYVGYIGWYPNDVSCINAREWYHVTPEDGKLKILPITKLACWNVRYQEHGVSYDVVFGSGPLTCHQ